MSAVATAVPVFPPPVGVRIRGVLAVLAGAGEGPHVYERFATRLSIDGYLVGLFDSDGAEAARDWLRAEPTVPRVLVGSDRGALAALAAVAAGLAIDGLIVAGLPVAGVDDATAAPTQRTACPLHRGLLDEPTTDATALRSPAVPEARALETIGIPVLAVHGGADEISPFPQAWAVLDVIPGLELLETVDGLHDALNDHSHRSVAANIVLWLERLRTGDLSRPIVRTVDR